jgi:hypothetical protein
MTVVCCGPQRILQNLLMVANGGYLTLQHPSTLQVWLRSSLAKYDCGSPAVSSSTAISQWFPRRFVFHSNFHKM